MFFNKKNDWISASFVEGLVSVIIPSYNRANLLQAAIDSLIDQTYRPIECIVIDDGSSDDTLHIVNNYIKKNTPSFAVVYKYQDNAGPQEARNNGTAISKGEFIQYLDSDDLLYPNKLLEQVNYLKQEIACDGVFGDWEVGDSVHKEVIKAHKENDMIGQIFAGRSIANFSFLMRRNTIANTGKWDVSLKTYHETDYHLTGLFEGARFDYQPAMCGLWRSHKGERFENTTQLNDIANFFDKWEIILKKENKFNDALAHRAGHLLIWFIQQNNVYDNKGTLRILKKAVSFNPDIFGFSQSRKFRILSFIIGEKLAFDAWSLDFRKDLKNRVEKNKSK